VIEQKERINGKKFLVTGGAGFIGSNLSSYILENGGKVRVLDNLSTGFAENIEYLKSYYDFEFIEGNIADFETCKLACEGIEYVSHQAALGSVPRSIKDPLATHKSNVDGFLNVLNAAREANVKRFVFASSSSVYGDSPELPKQEEVIGNALSPYAVSKLTNELYASVFSKVYGMEIIGLRYFNIFGPRQNPAGEYAAAIPLFIEGILNNKEIFINGDGEQTRDFTFVENAVQANLLSIFAPSKACNTVYNIAVGDRISLNNLITTIENVTGKKARVTKREPRPGDIRDSLAKITKAESSLGYKPRVKLEEGLRKTVEWFGK
jgi:UDP-N-acetylglucosamine 4-epimerase